MKPRIDAALTVESIERAVREGRASPEAAAEALSRARPMDRRYSWPGDPVEEAPPPRFTSWESWCGWVNGDETNYRVVRDRLARMAKHANRSRLLSGPPEIRIGAKDVRSVLWEAKGRCFHCGSLAVEGRPSDESGHPVPWAGVGRRVGSLGHLIPRFEGGGNEPSNLVWSCLWCNTWASERIPGAVDHGGIQPDRA